MTKILEIDGLQTHFHAEAEVVRALNGVNLSIERGETVGLVGGTGSGESVTAKSVMQLISNPSGEIVDGSIRLGGENVLEKPLSEIRAIRGSDIAIVFQDLSTSFNPVYTIRNQMIEVITTNRSMSRSEAGDIAHETPGEVEVSRPEGVLESYPREFPGGMKQRAVIAMKLACDPELTIADEPMTVLDVTTEKKVLPISSKLAEEHDLSMLWITHDLGVVAQFYDRVGVVHAGEVVEFGTVRGILHRPMYPYARELLKAIPNVANLKDSLGVTEGSVPDLVNPPSGCRFHPRCPDAKERCRSENPPKIRGANQYGSSCLVHEVTDIDHSSSESNSRGEWGELINTRSTASRGYALRASPVDTELQETLPDNGRDAPASRR